MSPRRVLPLALGSVGAITLLYGASIVIALRTPSIEKHAVYMHRLALTEGRDIAKPEQFGFAHKQTTPFYIEKEDGVRLFAWHVLPIGLYQKNFTKLTEAIGSGNKDPKFTKSLNFQLLRDDPEARLVIHTHGSSGNLAAYCRPEAYRSLSSTAPDKIHVLAFDYQGFGLSTGSPSEERVISDARAVFSWATEVANVPAERIVLFGQSMGAGVAIALARELAQEKVFPAGLIITSTFPSLITALSEYRTVFGLRAFGPFAKSPTMMAMLAGGMRNQWPNKDRLVDLIKLTPRHHIEIFHAKDDPIMPWYLSNVFLEHVAKAASDDSMTHEQFQKIKSDKTVDLGEGGWYVEWPTSAGYIRQEVARYGIHDRIMAQPQIAMAVARAFQNTDPSFLA